MTLLAAAMRHDPADSQPAPKQEGFLDLVVVGHIMIEHIRHSSGREEGPLLGGPAAYSSLVAARLGSRVGLVSKAGPRAPLTILAPLLHAGVDCRGLAIGTETRTTHLAYSHQGTKTLRFDHRGDPIRTADVPPAYLDAKAFFVCPVDLEVEPSVVDSLRRTDAVTMTDLGGVGGAASSTHPKGDPHGLSRVREWASRFDVVKLSDEDAALVFGEHVGPEQAGRLVRSWGVGVVLVTMGPKGAYLLTPGRLEHIPAIEVCSVDPTGAGDAYCAAFLDAFQETQEVVYSARFAAAVAALLTTKTGGASCERAPTLADAVWLMQRPCDSDPS